MKNIKKIFGIIALVSVIALSFAACDLDKDPGDDAIPKILVINNVPLTTTEGVAIAGKQITVAIYNVDNKAKTNIVALDQLIVQSTATAPITVTSQLVSGNEKKNGAPFTGTGSFYVYLLIGNSTDDLDTNVGYYYRGTGNSTIAKQLSITSATTSVDWSEFTKKN